MIYIGIDPGVSGGIAMIDRDGTVVDAVTMPTTFADIVDVLRQPAEDGHGARAALERVHAGVFGGKAGKMGVVSAFTFGRGVERLQCALEVAQIPYDEVLPVKWQGALGCLSKGDKNVTKRRAQQLFPSLTITHAIADALLMAEFCRRTHGRYGKDEDSPK